MRENDVSCFERSSSDQATPISSTAALVVACTPVLLALLLLLYVWMQ